MDLDKLLAYGSIHDNKPLQIYRSRNLKAKKIYVYVCLIYVSEVMFYKLFPLAVQITADELDQLCQTYEERITLIEIDTAPIINEKGKLQLAP